MATFTVTTAQNIDALAGKTGGDIYNINGGTLTIDQDSRYGLNQTTSTSLAAITLSSTLGGILNIDGRFVRLIAYTGGGGTVPASNTTISQGSASGKLISVYSSLTAAPTATGAAMPASGFIKIKQWNSVAFAAGALTGITANASGADTAGWLELVGDEAATLTAVRLGQVNITGEWYELGTTSGTANQTFQVPTSGSARYIAGVFIEKTVGSNDYEFYAAAGSQTSVATDLRAKVVWCTTAGIVRLGHNGTANAGFTPVSGLKVRIGNIFFENCTTAARTTNALPNATLATRYDFTTTNAGVISIDKANMAWYLSCAQAYSLALSNFGTLEQISISEIASPMTWSKVGVGQTAAQSQVAFIAALCFAGGTFTDCHFSRATLAASGNYTVTLTDMDGFTFTNNIFTALTVKGNATSGNILATRLNNSTFTNTKLINGRIVLTTCTGVTANTTSYCDVITGTTNTTAAQNSYVFEISTNCLNTTFSGVDFFGLTNVQAYLGILNVAAAGCTNTKLRNIGTYASPLSLGSTNGGAYLIVLATGAAANTVKVQRCYVSNTRTGLFTGDNSSTKVTFEDVFGDYADAPTIPLLNSRFKNIGATPSYTGQASVYGTHWLSHHTSTTAGRLVLMMNEETSVEDHYTITSGTPAFTSTGGIYMPTIGQQIEFTTPYWILGHNSFQNSAAVMAGGTIGNYTLEYQIDKNNGSGFSAWTTMNGANLSAETGISATLGFKMKWRITTATTNTAAITSLYILTNSNTTSQAVQHPLDVVTAKVTVKDANTLAAIQDARVYMTATGGGPSPDGTVLLTGTTDSSGVIQDINFAYLGNQNISGNVRKATSGTRYKPNKLVGTILSSGIDTTILLVSDE